MASTSDWALLKWDPPLRERSRRAENDRPTASPGRIRTEGNVRFHEAIALHHPRNETQVLSLMSRNRVKSGTAIPRIFKSTAWPKRGRALWRARASEFYLSATEWSPADANSRIEPELIATTPILITLPSKVVEIECAVAAAIVVRPRFFF